MVSKGCNLAAEIEIPDEISGLRMTRQRRHIYGVLLRHRDHPTANDVFMRIKDTLPNLSLATVYTCLDAMVKHGIIHDVKFRPGMRLEDVLDLPPGAVVKNVEFTLRGQLA